VRLRIGAPHYQLYHGSIKERCLGGPRGGRASPISCLALLGRKEVEDDDKSLASVFIRLLNSLGVLIAVVMNPARDGCQPAAESPYVAEQMGWP
jgi:hypothetical protein